MFKKRLYFLPLFVVIIVLLIVGSFLDLNIAKGIFDSGNGFGRFLSAFTATPICLIMAFVSGNLFKQFPRYKLVWQRILLIIAMLVYFGFATFLSGAYYVSRLAYSLNMIFILPIGLGISITGFLLGYFFFPYVDSKNYFRYIIFLTLTIVIAYGIILVIKEVVPRIRFTAIYRHNDYSMFRNWYSPDVPSEIVNQIKNEYYEEVKSFPSGHTALALSTLFVLIYLPLFKPLNKKVQIIFGVTGLIFYFLVVYVRMLMGAHYLSDTMFASLITICVIFICNEIFIRKIKLKEENELC